MADLSVCNSAIGYRGRLHGSKRGTWHAVAYQASHDVMLAGPTAFPSFIIINNIIIRFIQCPACLFILQQLG